MFLRAEGGPMTNGVMHTGTIDVGDLDAWTFTANAGDNVVVRMGETTNNSGLVPWLRLYGPNGALLNNNFSSTAAEVTVRATNSGTFLILVSDGNAGVLGSGRYRLNLVKTGDPIIISAGDEGGPMTNGVMHTGTIDVGDLDPWTFAANAGDNIIVRVGETNSGSSLAPWVRLYGPNGVLVNDTFGSVAAEVFLKATNNGAFIVVAADATAGLVGSGPYRLTLAKTGDAIVTSPGDEGGPMNGSGLYNGTIDLGDLDLWSFDACAGDNIFLRMDE